jgi:hypothetical protein
MEVQCRPKFFTNPAGKFRQYAGKRAGPMRIRLSCLWRDPFRDALPRVEMSRQRSPEPAA